MIRVLNREESFNDITGAINKVLGLELKLETALISGYNTLLEVPFT